MHQTLLERQQMEAEANEKGERTAEHTRKHSERAQRPTLRERACEASMHRSTSTQMAQLSVIYTQHWHECGAHGATTSEQWWPVKCARD